MKLFFFQCGTIKTKKRLLVAGAGDEELEVPVPFFLVEHPRGRVLFDTGQPLAAADCALAMSPEDFAPRQLSKLGFAPESIGHVILSHQHSDHAGAAAEFPNATVHAAEGPRDLFGDGKVKILPTPGHCPGHQSLLLELKAWGKTLLAADAAYTEEILDGPALPGVLHDRDATIKTLEGLRAMRRGGVRIVTGHDPGAWGGFKLAPAFYE